MTREELRAEIAMAICMAGCGIAAHWSDYFGEADAALAALEAAGVRLVYLGEAPTQLIDNDERTTVRIFTPYAPPGD